MRKETRKTKEIIVFLFTSILVFAAIIICAKYVPLLKEQKMKSDIQAEQYSELNFMIATDMHFISSELTDHGYYFQAMVNDADGKTMMYSEEVLDAFLVTVIQNSPDVLVLTGDITFNGAKKSHEDLAAKLAIVEEAGISVLVLSGNHDLNSRNAASFIGEGYERVEGITEEEFEVLYGAFGFEEACAKDTASSSYIWEMSGYRFLMLDVNGVESPNTVPKETLLWLETELKRAKEDGVPVVSFSHQNLLRHSFFTDGYMINNAGEVLRLYQEYDVRANFSGHLHIQHIEEKEGFYEIATSALAISPTQYGMVTLRGKGLEYQTYSVDVSGWAKRQGITNWELTGFEEYARKFFLETCDWQAYSELFFWPEYEDFMAEMIAYYSEQNYAYFSGRLDLIEQDEEILNKWKELGAFISVYLETIAQEERVSQNYFLLESQ